MHKKGGRREKEVASLPDAVYEGQVKPGALVGRGVGTGVGGTTGEVGAAVAVAASDGEAM